MGQTYSWKKWVRKLHYKTFILKRGTFICAHTWIFFKLCILITHYIRTMKMFLSNLIVKNKAKEATLTYSNFEVVPVSKFPCPKSIFLFIPMIWHLDWIQNTIDIISIPRNYLDKLWFTFSEEGIVKFQYFFSKIYKTFNIQFKRWICSRLCQDIILSQKHAIYILLIWAKYHENPKPVTLSCSTSYGYRSVLAKLII